jgi:hypothetical protein
MDIDKFRETLELTSDSELVRYVHTYVCLSLADTSNPASKSHEMLDLVYTECSRRGIEHLYDMSYKRACSQPQACKVLLAA